MPVCRATVSCSDEILGLGIFAAIDCGYRLGLGKAMHKFLIPREWILQDWATNAGQLDIRLFLAWFRMAQWAYNHWGPLGRLIYTPYTLISTTFLGIELPVSCTIGPRLRVYHKVGIVIHHECTIGSDCQIRHGVTLGSKFDRQRKTIVFPTIGDYVDIGACCAVIGDVHVGDHAEIGTHAVVTKSVPPWGIVVGNPARVIRIGDPESNTTEVWSKTLQAGSRAGEPPTLVASRVPSPPTAGSAEHLDAYLAQRAWTVRSGRESGTP